MSADQASPERGSRRLRATIGGRFEVDLGSPLGSSGQTLTYLGRDERTREPVAVKTIRLEHRQNPEARARFRRESRLLAFLNHPNVVRVLAVVEERGAPWVVLEHVPGKTVRDLIDAEGAVSPEAVVPILDQAAAALDHLHARGLVHLDVSPANLLLAADGRLVLTDFARAQSAGQPAEAGRALSLGTAVYLAPELLGGEPVGPAADVYALGCVVYELLTGMTPFSADDAGSTHDAIRSWLARDPTPPSEVRPDLALPGWTDDVVLWALARDPTRRYATTVAFADLFRSWLDGNDPPIVAEPPRDGRGRPRRTLGSSRPSPVESIRPSEREVVRAAVRRGSGAAGGAPAIRTTPIGDAGTDSRTGRPALRDEAEGGPIDRSSLKRWLWIAFGVLLVVDLLLGIALLVTRGRLFGF